MTASRLAVVLSTGPSITQRRVAKREIASMALRKTAFIRSLKEAEKTVEEKLDDFLKDGNEDAIHDTRTAMRRLEAHIDLLPKRVRKNAEVKDLLKKHDRVMKKSADIRDLDVIRGKIARHKADPAKLQLLKKIDKRRKRLMKNAKDLVAAAQKLKVPPAALNGVTDARLQRRLEKVVTRLTTRITGLLPVVAKDSRKLEELHLLRIDGRKLRYTLELVMDEKSDAIQRLKKWQDALGKIHDLDVMVEFLGKFKSAFAAQLRRETTTEREHEFTEFANSVLNRQQRP